MISSTYNWVGLGVGLFVVLIAASALVQDLQGPLDLGTIGFTLAFGFFWAVIAATCAYGLLHGRGQALSSGCLFIALVVGGLLALTGAALLVPSLGDAQKSDRLVFTIFLGLGATLLVPSGLLLWHRRARTPKAASMRLWQGVVAGLLTIFLVGQCCWRPAETPTTRSLRLTHRGGDHGSGSNPDRGLQPRPPAQA